MMWFGVTYAVTLGLSLILPLGMANYIIPVGFLTWFFYVLAVWANGWFGIRGETLARVDSIEKGRKEHHLGPFKINAKPGVVWFSNGAPDWRTLGLKTKEGKRSILLGSARTNHAENLKVGDYVSITIAKHARVVLPPSLK